MQINPSDNVAVSLEQDGNIPFGHKIALESIAKGADVIKYGEAIGMATTQIAQGDWVHTHNVKTKLDQSVEYNYEPRSVEVELPKYLEEQTFEGYLRSPRLAGVRNEIWIIPTVSCTNQIATTIAQIANSKITDNLQSNVDGVYAFGHPYGCSQLGDDHANTQRILAGLTKHPNAAGVLVIGLGCENNLVSEFKEAVGTYDENQVKFMVCQDVEDEITMGTEIVMDLVKKASLEKRQKLPLSLLNIGLKCGGSDGLSGITANPLVGRISDLVVAAGGTSVLTEVPEMFGAEHLLMNRAVNNQVFAKIVTMITDFKDYFRGHNQPVYENPSPGNKEGGITTLEDKSLGTIQKGGTSTVMDVLQYGEQATVNGLNLLYSPGNDMVSTTALAAAGCQIVLFTTGRGTPLGTCVPTLKISSNSKLYQKKQHWTDFDAGQLLTGRSVNEASEELLNKLIHIASGTTQTKNEQIGFREIAIWKGGVTL